MFCTNCGRQIIDTARFCNYCGTAVVRDEKPAVQDISQNLSNNAAFSENSAVSQPTEAQNLSAALSDENSAGLIQSSRIAETAEPIETAEQAAFDGGNECSEQNVEVKEENISVGKDEHSEINLTAEPISAASAAADFQNNASVSDYQQIPRRIESQKSDFAAAPNAGTIREEKNSSSQNNAAPRMYTIGHIIMCLASTAVMAIAAGVFAGLYFSVV